MENRNRNLGVLKINQTSQENQEVNSTNRFESNDPYIVLGVLENSSAIEIVSAWKKLVLRYHPDISKDPKAKEICQNLNGAVRKLVSKNGTLLKYSSKNTNANDGFDFNVAWDDSDGYWTYVNEAWEGRFTDENLKNEVEAKEEKDYILKMFTENGYKNYDLLMPGWEESGGNNYRYFYKVGSIYKKENLIEFQYKQMASQHKMRIYNNKGDIVFDGSKDSLY